MSLKVFIRFCERKVVVRYTKRAKEELEIAFDWYESQKLGLGIEFIDAIEKSVDNIVEFPQMYQIIYRDFRRALSSKFPYVIFYTLQEDSIIIHAILNNRQNPMDYPK